MRIVIFIVAIVLLVQFSGSIFGFDAKKSLKDTGLYGTVTRMVCGDKGCGL